MDLTYCDPLKDEPATIQDWMGNLFAISNGSLIFLYHEDWVSNSRECGIRQISGKEKLIIIDYGIVCNIF